MKYKLVKSMYLDDLEMEVNSLTRKGWKLHGLLVQTKVGCFVQALVYKETK